MKLAIIGQGGHSKVIKDIALTLNNIEIIGYFDDKYTNSYINQGIYYGSIQSSKELLESFDELRFIIAIGDNRIRKRIYEKMGISPQNYAQLIHPSAIISPSASIGPGSVVMANAVVNADAKIRNHSIINTGSIIEHDTKIGEFVHISPKVVLTGGVTIDDGAHIGAGATVLPQKSVGKWSIIGAGATVTKNIPNNCTAVGTPATIKKSGSPLISAEDTRAFCNEIKETQ